MILMNIFADNFYCFKNFEINFAYKKINSSSLIKNEYLENYSNIKFKKVNVFMGPNASGKTVFGKLYLDILSLIENKDNRIINNITIPEKEAKFIIDFILKAEKYILYRIECVIKNNIVKNLKIKKTNVISKVSYNKIIEELEDVCDLINYEDEFLTQDMMKALKSINLKSNALFCFTDEVTSSKNVVYDIDVLNKVLKVFDSSIKEVKPVKETEDGYLITFNHGYKLLIQNGKAVEGNILSSGTKEGLSIAYVISEMKKNPNRTFYIDEKFSHVHTEIEISILSLMIGLLGKEAQLFFTTHNLDVLNMSLPHHVFTFFSKRYDEVKVTYSDSSKNDRSLRNKVENDFFETLPDCSPLFELVGD